jgi:hypothetical protein
VSEIWICDGAASGVAEFVPDYLIDF